jgi:Haem-binding domain
MKKIARISVAFAAVLFCTALFANAVSAQAAKNTGEVQKPIPADVTKFLEKSCMGCHAEGGEKMAMSMVNISNWEKYSPEKQAEKAKKMCKMATKGKMPPKGFRTSNPDAVPTQADIKLLCDWAQSLQVAKK